MPFPGLSSHRHKAELSWVGLALRRNICSPHSLTRTPICPSPKVARLESCPHSPCLSQRTGQWSRRWGGRPWISAASCWAPGSPETITSTGGPIQFSRAGGK